VSLFYHKPVISFWGRASADQKLTEMPYAVCNS
jgi:hypothetical protein